MNKYAGILILIWIAFRLLFHSVSFNNTNVATFVYFTAQNLAIISLSLVLFSFAEQRRVRFLFLSGVQLKRIIKTVITYSTWCLIVDILLLSEIGAHDSTAYTAISMGIISIGALWAIFV
jgi:hypothetical protein